VIRRPGIKFFSCDAVLDPPDRRQPPARNLLKAKNSTGIVQVDRSRSSKMGSLKPYH
jgi:hypothetical protein